MTTDSPSTPARPSGPWGPLDVNDRRILGVLIEKQKTTNDSYPLSVNALMAGSNQKSNREPVLDLGEDDVEETLEKLLRRQLVERAPSSGRVERWRHLLYVAWEVEKVEMAILAELLLRGPQTEGELRTRASRMDPIDDLETLRTLLGNLKRRNLVVYLTAEERRGAVVTHGFHDKAELEYLKHQHAGGTTPPAPRPAIAPPLPPVDDRVPALVAEVAGLRRRMDEMAAEMAELRKGLRELKDALGA
jgi:uncharacterized protein